MAFLELRNVSKGFSSGKGRTRILADVSLDIEEREFVAVLGFSGSGKTTLISLMAGLLQPDSGRISMRGKPIRGPGPERGVVFQNYSLLPWLSTFDNVALAVDRVFSGWSKQKRREHVIRHLEMVNLGHALHKKPRELSGGMRQRVAVARALAMNPEVLLLDEPLSALDALTRASLQTEIERIWAQERKTIVMITNDVDEGLLLADRIVPLTPGPDAGLGPSFEVGIGRPRDRRALNHDPEFKRIRNEVIRYLSDLRARRPGRVSAPNIQAESEPEGVVRAAALDPAGGAGDFGDRPIKVST
jgi:nitrate/nitrite transport system ATP-binding protein